MTSAELALLLWLALVPSGQGSGPSRIAVLEKTAAERPGDPRVWYVLGQAYNAVKQEALASFGDRDDEAPWQQLIVADTLAARGQLTDAFVLYREVLERLPSMVTIHDAIAGIYERTGQPAWATRERASGGLAAADCAARSALCAFRAGRYEASLAAALTDDRPESRYWRARAAAELALASFARLEKLPDSAERRAVRATQARAEDRHTDAIGELKAALAFAPGEPSLQYELAASYYAARNYEEAIATLDSLLGTRAGDPRLLKLKGYALLQLRRLEEAVPVLQQAIAGDPGDPGVRLALGRAHVQSGNFAAAIPLIEAQLADDRDGSLHLQLARAYSGLGQRDRAAAFLAKSQELQRTEQERNAEAAKRRITAPK